MIQASIIVPVYNGESFIRPCLDSVTTQTLPQDQYEIIVVDDGSRDDSLQLLREYEERYDFITVISQENKGPAISRTVGVQAAQGEYVFILSQDCIAYPDWLETVIKVFEDDAAVGIVQGQITSERPIDIPIHHCTVVMQFSYSFETAGIAYRASAIDEIGRNLEDELAEFGDDTDFAWRIIESGYSAKWIDHPTVTHLVLPEKFWKQVKRSWGIQKFALLVKKHPGIRRYLRWGFLWSFQRLVRYVLLVLTILLGLLGWFWLSGAMALLFIFMSLRSVLRQTKNMEITLQDKLFLVLPHHFLTMIIGETALIIGSIKHRSVVL